MPPPSGFGLTVSNANAYRSGSLSFPGSLISIRSSVRCWFLSPAEAR